MPSNTTKRLTSSFSTLATAVVAICTLVASDAALAANYYKYKNESGIWVISHDIPAALVKNGYLIIDDRGRVIEEVERQLSAEEYAAKLEREAAVKACTDARRRVRNLYQGFADIDYAEQQAVESIENSIANLRANLTHIQNQKKDLESQAAQMDLAGQTLPPVLLANIERAQTEETNLLEAIEQKVSEKEQLGHSYDYDRRVFDLTDCDSGLPPTATRDLAGTAPS